jgi:hypothetical protein
MKYFTRTKILLSAILAFLIIVPSVILSEERVFNDEGSTVIKSENNLETERKFQDSNHSIIKTETQTQAQIINKEQIRNDISTVSKSIQELEQEFKRVEDEIRTEIKQGIDSSIIEIRSEQNIEAYLLQRAVDPARNDAYTNLRETFRDSVPIDSAVVRELGNIIDQSVREIEEGFRTISNQEVKLEQTRQNIERVINRYAEEIDRNRALITERRGDLFFLDSDGDGLSDYDEIFIYGTDPNNSNTSGGELNDFEKVAAGLNPLSAVPEPKNYEDPRDKDTAYVSNAYSVTNIKMIPETKELVISGTGLPNGFVTIYIFSTPTIVTVRTNSRGEWTYTLDKQLEDGQHQIYVATVDNSGSIIAKSSPVPFVKTAEAASIGSLSGIGQTGEQGTGNFFQDNFYLIIISIVLVALMITISLFGKKSRINV